MYQWIFEFHKNYGLTNDFPSHIVLILKWPNTNRLLSDLSANFEDWLPFVPSLTSVFMQLTLLWHDRIPWSDLTFNWRSNFVFGLERHKGPQIMWRDFFFIYHFTQFDNTEIPCDLFQLFNNKMQKCSTREFVLIFPKKLTAGSPNQKVYWLVIESF